MQEIEQKIWKLLNKNESMLRFNSDLTINLFMETRGNNNEIMKLVSDMAENNEFFRVNKRLWEIPGSKPSK